MSVENDGGDCWADQDRTSQVEDDNPESLAGVEVEFDPYDPADTDEAVGARAADPAAPEHFLSEGTREAA